MSKKIVLNLFVLMLSAFSFVIPAHANRLKGKDAVIFKNNSISRKNGLVFQAITMNSVKIPSNKYNLKFLAINGKYNGCLLKGSTAQWGGDKIWAQVNTIECPNKYVFRSPDHISKAIGIVFSYNNDKPEYGLIATTTKTLTPFVKKWKYAVGDKPCPSSYSAEFGHRICAKWFVKNNTIVNILIDEKTVSFKK